MVTVTRNFRSLNFDTFTYSFFFSFLFDHVREDLGPGLALSVQQICWYSSFGCFLITLLLCISLLMHFNAAKNEHQY